MTKSAVSKYLPPEFRPKTDDAEGETIESEAAPPVIDSPGVYQQTNEQYHAGPGVSRSMLWTQFTKTPLHARYGERKATDPQKLGDATGVAVLEPGTFDARFYRGPSDRRGKKWDAAEEIAREVGKTCLTEAQYDDALRMADCVHRNPIVRKLISGQPSIEQSAYSIDEATGELVKVRPDLHSHTLAIQADLKTAADASEEAFAKSVAEYGYHVQRAMYPLVWEAAGGSRVDAFVFIVVESKHPHPVAIYELDPYSTEEGLEVYRHALDDYHRCSQIERAMRHDNEIKKSQGKKHLDDAQLEVAVRAAWPGLPSKVTTITMPPWGFKLRKPA